MRLARTTSLSLACLGTAALFATAAAPPARAESALPVGGLGDAAAGYALHPASSPGMNDWTCTPSAAHPDPVVLLPGTFANIGSNFVALAPLLKNAGYCVYGTNFGMTWLSAGGRVGGLDTETASGDQVSAFINRVLTATGAPKVDIVGHSQGGSMGINYLKLHAGGNKVGTYVGWGQSSNGTTLSGLVTGASALGALGIFNVGLAALGAPGLRDQEVGSAYNEQTAAIPLPQGPKYVTIQTTRDAVVTPYATQSLPGAQNIVLQNLCPKDQVGHVGLFLDSPTLQLTMNALGGGPDDFRPSCSGYGPAL